MKKIFKDARFKVMSVIAGLLVLGMLISAASGHSESAQSGVVGIVFAPAHWVASKISSGVDRISDNAKGNAEYEKEIDGLEKQVGDLQDRLADYENLKAQNELYKEALELKDENKDFEYVSASVTGRDNADPFCSFMISKGTVSGVKSGDAVLYGKYLIGTVKKAYPTYSVVVTVLDPKFAVSAYSITSGEVSYVTGDVSLAKDGLCKFENLDASTDVTYGSIIASAGISSTIPKGLIIGTVEEINDEATNISSYAVLKPGTDVSKITSCFVLTGFTPSNGGE